MKNKINQNLLKLAKLTYDPKLKIDKNIFEQEEKKVQESKSQVCIPEHELEKQKGNNLLTLESKVDFSRNVTNEVVLKADGQTVKYIGYAEDLWIDGNDIRGRAKLRRYDLREKVKKGIKIISWFPPRIKTEEVNSQEWIKRWGVVSDESNHKYFVSSGKLANGYDCDAYYRAALKGSAADDGINLSNEIFEAVFGPIDNKIMELYRKFHNEQK